ncbi:MAG: class I SAM-dependent methyltransferase [Actinomycetota bacterium]|nr:class I SAM-dependent methyltransferase [Actinomycetota bacterium]
MTSRSTPVVYAGAFPLEPSALPPGIVVLGRDGALAPALDAAAGLVVLDALSFPFAALRPGDRDLPMVLRLPDELDAAGIEASLGPQLADLGPDDRLAAPDASWADLRRRYGWSHTQRLMGGDGLESVARAAVDELVQGAGGVRWTKSAHRLQAGSVGDQLDAALAAQPVTRPPSGLVVAPAVQRWVGVFLSRHVDVSAMEAEPERLGDARAGYPELAVDALEMHLRLPFPPDRFDLALCADLAHRRPAHEQRRLVSEVWRAVRPGGRIVLVEDLVDEGGRDEPWRRPMSVPELTETVLAGTDRRVVTEHVEALRYPGDDLYRGGVITLTKIGVPVAW